MTMVKALFVLATLTLGTEALAQDSSEANDMDQTVAYADLDGSGRLDEIVLSSNADGDVTVDVAFDVPEERADASSSFDPVLLLEIMDGAERDDLSLVVRGDTTELVDADWAALGEGSSDREDYEPDVHLTYRATGGNAFSGPIYYPWGPISCWMVCDEWDGYYCLRSHWVCG